MIMMMIRCCSSTGFKNQVDDHDHDDDDDQKLVQAATNQVGFDYPHHHYAHDNDDDLKYKPGACCTGSKT